jgi:hypothetical protein
MRFKGTLALLLAFLALGAYVYFVEYGGREAREQQEAAKKKVFPIEAENVAELTLEFQDRTVAAVRKDDKTWQMTSPAGMEADSEVWESLAANLAKVEKEDPAVVEKADDLAQYGLDKPFVKVTGKLQNGDTIGIVFGSENPRKTFRYAKQLNQEAVFLSSTSWSSGFDKSLYDLRDKSVLTFDSESVDLVRIAVSGRPEIELQKSGMDWLLRKPVETAADSSEAASFLSALQFARATEFAAPDVDARKAGLDPPDARVTLREGSGTERVVLIGKASGEENVYVKDQSRPAILVVAKDLAEKVRRPVMDWRDKSIARLNRDGIDEIELVKGAEKFTFKKVGADWQTADGKKVRSDRVSEWLSSLEFDRATDILDSPKALSTYGLEVPRARLVLREGGKEVLSLAFGREAPGAGVYVRTSLHPQAVLVAPQTLFDKFNVPMTDLLDSPPETPVPAK